MRTLGGIVKDSPNEASQIAAASVLLERGWGRPTQDNTHEIKGEIQITLRKLLSGEPEDSADE